MHTISFFNITISDDLCEGFEVLRLKIQNLSYIEYSYTANFCPQRLPDLLGYGAGAAVGHGQLPGREQLPGGQPHQPRPPPPPQHPHRAHV